jgi:hypothetical protein
MFLSICISVADAATQPLMLYRHRGDSASFSIHRLRLMSLRIEFFQRYCFAIPLQGAGRLTTSHPGE